MRNRPTGLSRGAGGDGGWFGAGCRDAQWALVPRPCGGARRGRGRAGRLTQRRGDRARRGGLCLQQWRADLRRRGPRARRAGAFSTLYDGCDGRPLRAPNDIVFDADGGFWFTDYGKSDDWTLDRGYLVYARPDGSAIRRVRGGLLGPNGVGLSPDGATLYVAETYTGRLWAMEVTGPGQLGPSPAPWMPGRLIATLPGHQMIDSLAVEAAGRICVAGGPDGGVTVFAPDGGHEHIRLPGEIVVTNICFAGADMRDAYITASGSGRLYRTRWPRPGLKLSFNA
jgi:gluconolactonase